MAFLAGGRFGWALSAMLRATPYASPTTPTAFLDRPNFPTDMPSICRLRWRQTSLQVAVLKLESVADFGLFLVVEFSGIRTGRSPKQIPPRRAGSERVSTFACRGCGPFALLPRLDAGLGGGAAVLETPGLVAGLHDVAVMRQAIEQGSRHLGVAEHAGPFVEGEVGRDQDRK